MHSLYARTNIQFITATDVLPGLWLSYSHLSPANPVLKGREKRDLLPSHSVWVTFPVIVPSPCPSLDCFPSCSLFLYFPDFSILFCKKFPSLDLHRLFPASPLVSSFSPSILLLLFLSFSSSRVSLFLSLPPSFSQIACFPCSDHCAVCS